MTTEALIGIIPPIIAAGAVIYIANRALNLGSAQKAWPNKPIHAYRITWGDDETRQKGKRVIYGPNSASAVEAFEEKYPSRHINDIDVRPVR